MLPLKTRNDRRRKHACRFLPFRFARGELLSQATLEALSSYSAGDAGGCGTVLGRKHLSAGRKIWAPSRFPLWSAIESETEVNQ